ncbi:MAG: leucine dehydrogenase [Planctomycetes bacterium]|nr:leucine dehydrogenase [Planctomycetota bacterium]
MAIHLLEAMSREGFEEVIALHDRRSGLRAFLAIHDSTQGPAFGGLRRWSYLDEDQALRDCLRLSRAMTYKCALAGLAAGGAKLVILDRTELDLRASYRAIGALVERFAGRFYTGPDVGTDAEELGWVAEQTRYVTRPDETGPGLLAESTCAGVFAGIAACLRHLDGEEDWGRRTIVVQGLGAVGRGLSRLLLEAGARVRASDLDGEKAERVARELDLELVDPATEYDQACDVFAPCALGGILHDLTLTRLRCRIVAGGANNVLVRSLHGERLHERGVLYAPDFAINSGALIRGALFHLEGRRESVEAIGARIEAALEGILARSREEGLAPVRVAVDEAAARIARWRGESPAEG